jgi:hypothetical protein
MTAEEWPEHDITEGPSICACCVGAGILWAVGGPVICPYCRGCGENVRIEAPLALNLAELN